MNFANKQVTEELRELK